MKKSTIAVLAVSLMCLLAAALFIVSNRSTYDQDTKTSQYGLIGVSQPNLTEPWRIVMNNEISEEVDKHDDMRVIFTDAAGSPEKQQDDIDKLMEYGIDLLIVSMSDAEYLTPIVSEIYKEIPVIVLDRDVLGYDYSLFIGLDNQIIGETAGYYVADHYKDRPIKIIEILGDVDSVSTKGRTEGFKSIIDEYPNIEILDRIECDWKRDDAQDKFGAYLDDGGAVPDIIYAHSDDMAYGTYLALQARTISGVDSIGMDALPGQNGGIELIKKGILVCSFTCPTGGKEAIQSAVEILNNESIIPKKILLRSYEITRHNVDAYEEKEEVAEITTTDVTVGFAQVGAESAWRTTNTDSIISAAEEAGVDLIFENVDNNLSDAEKQAKQIEFIEGFIEENVDVIAFSPIVETGWDDVLQKAKNAGIPVILSDRLTKASADLWTSFIGSDFVEQGRRGALWLLENTADMDTVRIVELRGTQGAAPTIGRQAGFKEGIAEQRKYQIIYSETADFEYEDGKEVTQEALEKFQGQIDVIFAHNDDMGLGAIDAIEEYGLRPGTDILIISIDATREAFEAMIQGKLNIAVECNPLLGPQIMKSAIQLANGIEIPRRIITRESVYTTENAEDFIESRKY